MRDWSKTEISFLVIATAIFSLSVYTITNDLGGRKVPRIDAQESVIGRIKSRQNDVRRKRSDEMAFATVSSDYPVFDRDSVFTGENSQAEIALKTGADLQLAAKSLVVITLDHKGDEELTLRLGSFLAKIKPSGRLRLPGLEVKASADTVLSMQKNDLATQITVLKGELAISGADGSHSTLKQNQSSEIASTGQLQKIKTHPIALVNPPVGDIVWSKGRSKLKFAWQNAKSASNYRVVVAKDPEFKSVVAEKTIRGDEAELDLEPAGNLHWRVEEVGAKADDGGSPVSTFAVLDDSAPVLTAPANESLMKTEPGRTAMGVQLAWNDETLTEIYQIQIAKDPRFQGGLVSGESKKTTFVFKDATEGEYFWRVRSVHPSRPSPPWSESRRFKVAITPSEVRAPAKALEIPPLIAKFEPPPPPPTPQLSPRPEPIPTPAPPPAPATAATSTPLPMVEATPAITSIPISSRVSPTEAAPPAFWLWVGAGASFHSYKQTVSTVSDVEFGNIDGPMCSAKGGSRFSETMGIELSYSDTPSKAKSGPGLEIRNGDYHWKTITAEALWYMNPALRVRFGVQNHSSPFLIPAASGVIDLTDATFTTASAGFDYTFWPKLDALPSRRLRYEIMMRYQHPFTSSGGTGSDLKLNPKYSFDGSLGQIYKLSEPISIGVFWHGQWHSYSFDYKGTANAISFSGDQSTFNSNVEFRLGIEF